MNKPGTNILLFSVFLLWFGAAGSVWGASPVIRHDLRITLLPQEQSLAGVDHLTVPSPGGPEMVLHLAPDARIEEVLLEGRPVPHQFVQGRLIVVLPGEVRPPETSLTVSYRAAFRDPVPENPVHSEDPSYGVAGAITRQGIFLGEGAGWYPDIPGSQAVFRLRVEAPPGVEAVTAGRLISRGEAEGRTCSTWMTAAPLPSLSLAAGPYRIGEDRLGDISLYTYFYPQTTDLATSYLTAAKGYLDLYQGLFGPYPFPKFAVAENFFPTGYGFPSWTLLGSSVVRLPFIVETSLGHEIAHSWWGNGVRVAYARGNWSEGLTTYVADHLYQERESPEAAREYRLKILRDYAALVPPEKDFALASFTSRTSAAGQAVGYGKGAMVFHMARRRTGDEAFWAGLKEMAAKKMFQRADWQDFARALGRASGEDLSGFFHQWVDRPGAPVLALRDVSAARDGQGWRITGLLVQDRPAYDLRVPLRLETQEGALNTLVEISGISTPFLLRASSAPQVLVVDPEVDIFRRLDPTEIPPTVNAVRGSTDLVAVAAANLPRETLAAARSLLAALRQEQTPLLPENEVSPAFLKGRDVLFFGLPGRALRPPLPEGLEIGADAFRLQEKDYSEPGAALFATLAHPFDRKRTAAIFLPLSPQAARLAVRKIPHYGKYSYLVFFEGENRAKGTWPAPASPTRYAFPALEVSQ